MDQNMKKTAIAAFAFGRPKTITPNKFIATMATAEAVQHKAIIFTQADVEIIDANAKYFPSEIQNNPPPTLRIARWIIQSAMQDKIELIVVAAAGPHAWRCKRDLQIAAKEAKYTVEIKIAKPKKKISTTYWFTKNSTQERTQSWCKWWNRETILWLMPVFIYKKVAS
jgi:hypothetical protein